MSRILATVNQYRLGGTETYLASAARGLAARGLRCDLMTSQLLEAAPHLDAFAQVSVAGDGSRTRILEQWMTALGETLARRSFRAVWSHHFDLLPIWAATRLHELSLLSTFHGPLTGASRPNPPIQALGMTLAIHRGEAVSCVSEEAALAVRGLRPDPPLLSVIPNRVEIGPRPARAPELPPRRFLLVARPQKLAHLRAALSIFRDATRWRRGCTLTVLAAEERLEAGETGSLLARLIQRGRLCRARFGARWSLRRPLSFLRLLPQLRFVGAAEDVAGLMERADLVLGMGRVVLEGLAARRPALLIGYEHPHGVVTSARLDRFAHTNYSGRQCEPLTVAESVAEIRGLNSLGWELSSTELERLDVERTVDELQEIFAAVGSQPAATESDRALAQTIANMAREGASDEAVVERVGKDLTAAEQRTLRALIQG